MVYEAAPGWGAAARLRRPAARLRRVAVGADRPAAPPGPAPRLADPGAVAAVLVGAGITYAVTSGGGRKTPTASNVSTVFTVPDSVDGVPKSSNTTVADTMGRMIAAGIPNSKTATGVYVDPANPKRIIVLLGVEAKIKDPEAELKGGFVGLGITVQGMSTPKTYPAGPQGGQMQCAHGTVNAPNVGALPVAACIIIDGKGMIFLTYYSTTEAHAVDVITALRPKFETG